MTRDEKRAIERGYETLVKLTETDHTQSERLDLAYTIDKRGRSNKFYTMSILCETFLEGYNDENARAARVYGLAIGPGIMYAIGAYWRSRHGTAWEANHTLTAADEERLQAAVDARRANINRRFEAVK